MTLRELIEKFAADLDHGSGHLLAKELRNRLEAFDAAGGAEEMKPDGHFWDHTSKAYREALAPQSTPDGAA